jgi:hypothetical protein
VVEPAWCIAERYRRMPRTFVRDAIERVVKVGAGNGAEGLEHDVEVGQGSDHRTEGW